MKILFLSNLRKKGNTGKDLIKLLKNMGHEVYPVNIRSYFPLFRVKRVLKTRKPDILFTFKGVGNLDFKKINYKFKRKIIWYPDVDIFIDGKFNENLREIFTFHDFIFVIVKSKVGELRKILNKKDVYWMVQGARFFEYDVKEIPEKFKCDVGFIGSLNGPIYSKRREILASICKRFKGKYRIKLWGKKMRKNESFYEILNDFHTGKKVLYEDFKKACLGSKIIIDIASNNALREEGAVSQKVFMITGCGGFLILQYFKEIEEFFEIGKEIEVYKSLDEVLRKIEYYIERDEERKKISQRAKERVLKEHLYIHRLKSIFEICKI